LAPALLLLSHFFSTRYAGGVFHGYGDGSVVVVGVIFGASCGDGYGRGWLEEAPSIGSESPRWA